VLLVPVFLVWALFRWVAQRAAVWDSVSSNWQRATGVVGERFAALRNWIMDGQIAGLIRGILPDRSLFPSFLDAIRDRVTRSVILLLFYLLIGLPLATLELLAWLLATIADLFRRAWYRTMTAVRRLLRGLTGDDWRDDIPVRGEDDGDSDRIHDGPPDDSMENAGTVAAASDRLNDVGSDDARDSADQGELAGETDDVGDSAVAGDDPDRSPPSDDLTAKAPSDGVSIDFAPSGATVVDDDSGSGPIIGADDIEIGVLMEGEQAEDSTLERALRNLGSLDRTTASELAARKADRDERLGTTGEVEELMSEVRDRGLGEKIRRLFARIPPEERRDRRGKTGYRLNLEAVAETGGGRVGTADDLFYRRRWTNSGDRTVGVAIDLSGSVDAAKARLALAGLAEATRLLGDTFVAAGFRDSSVSVPLITGPDEPLELRHLTAVETGGTTPTADGIREIRRLVKRTHDEVKLVFVVTDGAPNVRLRDADDDEGDPIGDAKHQVEVTRRDDIVVIGVGVGRIRDSRMESLFGSDGYVVVSGDTLAEDLLEVYRDQIQSLAGTQPG